jgi:uncharacterized membrane protein
MTESTPTGLSDNSAGALAYVTFIPAIVFLAMPPYNQSPYVRFHAWQSIFLFVAWSGATRGAAKPEKTDGSARIRLAVSREFPAIVWSLPVGLLRNTFSDCK